MPVHRRSVAFAWAGGAVAVTLCATPFAQEVAPPVVAYRPSVATPTDLPAPGWPQMDAGWTGTQGGDTARSQAVPVTFRLAWSESWGLILGTSVYEWQRDFDGSTARSGGDTNVALKYRLPINDSISVGAEIGASLPTARPPIGSGKVDWAGIAIASIDSDIAHVDINVAAARLGAVDEGQGRCQGLWAIAASRPLGQVFTITGEVSGVVQRGTRAQSQALAGLNYSVSPQVVVDAGVAKGLSHTGADWVVTAGITFQLGRWF